jgi:NADPH:quinone reductase-like Zn-dependent oxidoreductase
MRRVTVQGIFVGSRAMFESMNRAITNAKLVPVVDQVFAFDDAVDAFQTMKRGSHFGKIAIRVGR